MFSWLVGQSCKPCSESDPTSDTVKFDPPSLVAEKDVVEQLRQEAEDIAERERVAALEAERARAAAEEEERRRQEELAVEMQRQKDEAEQQARLQRQHEEEQAEAERQRVQEETRKHEEERVRVERERAHKEKTDAKMQVEAWLSKHGYADVNAKKTQMFKTTYPLHHAVKQGDADAVRLLLRFRADAKQKCSGQTPLELVQKQGKKASSDVLALLAPQTQPRRIAGA